MAMRRYTPQELAQELERVYWCANTELKGVYGEIWKTHEGRHFNVPPPGEDGMYPDWMLDEILARAHLKRRSDN